MTAVRRYGLPWRSAVPAPGCMLEACAIETPAALHAYMVRPEQSNALGPAAP